MARLFTVLAVINMTALLATFAAGTASRFWSHDLYLLHFTLGLFTAIGTLLVHCLIFTYFLGTGRWVKEVGLAYRLPDEGLPKTTRELKRTSFPPALIAMLVTIAASAAGAGAQLRDWEWYVHGGLAVATILVNLWAFRLEIANLRVNAVILDQVLVEVDRIRAERGLPDNATALVEEKERAARG
jgi:hypothetical protein